MSERESKKTEGEIEQLQDEELNAVAGGFLGITIYDQCSNENPERRYRYNLCGACENFERHVVSNNPRTTEYYCGKVHKVIYRD